MILNPSQLAVDDRSTPTQSGVVESQLPQPGAAGCESLFPGVSEYLLVCEASVESLARGTWHFTLQQTDGTSVFSAADEDIGDLNRLTLLAAVRGLESIDGPASVTLLSNNRYLIRSLSDSLPRWRESNFVWEHFGQRIDVQHADLWRRVDRALSIHRVAAVLISSRLVSQGVVGGDVAGNLPKALRVDAPHDGVPRRKSQRKSRSGECSPAQDRLRQWLISNAGSQSAATARHRFTAADLMTST